MHPKLYLAGPLGSGRRLRHHNGEREWKPRDTAAATTFRWQQARENGMLERSDYRTALYLSALIAVVHCSFYGYSLSYFPRLAHQVMIYALIAVAVCAGLWLLSKISRYVGAAFYLFSAVAAVLPWLSFDKNIMMTVGTVWGVSMGVLSLVAALILIFSKSFGREFAAELETRPVYKKQLLNAFAVLIVLAAAAAILNDIVNLASN